MIPGAFLRVDKGGQLFVLVLNFCRFTGGFLVEFGQPFPAAAQVLIEFFQLAHEVDFSGAGVAQQVAFFSYGLLDLLNSSLLFGDVVFQSGARLLCLRGVGQEGERRRG